MIICEDLISLISVFPDFVQIPLKTYRTNSKLMEIIFDEISTETETLSARTIAERGVQLIATAHGNSLVNLVKNPILVNLIGGIQSVTLSDQSAKLRNTKKSILEKQFAATFDLIIEISSSDSWIVYDKVEESVDSILNGESTNGQARLDLTTHLEINYP